MGNQETRPVLIITRDFDPHCPRPGSMIRIVSLANFLAQQGFKPHVLATRRIESQHLLEVDPAVSVHWVFGLIEYFGGKPRNRWLLPIYWPVAALRLALSRLRPTWYIDSSSLDIGRLTARAIKLCREHDIRHVLVSSPPHSLQQIGIALKDKLGPRLQYIADLRDGWTIRTMYQPHAARVAATQRQEAIERSMFSAANCVTVVSTGMQTAYRDKYPDSSRIEVVPNGYDEARPSPPTTELEKLVRTAHGDGKLVLGYFGSATIGYSRGHKDLAPLIRAISGHPELAKRVILVIFGYIELQLMPLPPNVFLYDVVPLDEARANMRLLDIGIVLHSDDGDAPVVMGGKLYEYAAAGAPIWIIAPPTASSLIDFTQETGKPLFTNIHDAEEIRRHLEQLMNEKALGNELLRRFSKSESAAFSRSAQYGAILRLLEESPL